jgi:hypothetical protein
MPTTTNKSDNDAANEPDRHGNAGFGAAESQCWESLDGQVLEGVIELY